VRELARQDVELLLRRRLPRTWPWSWRLRLSADGGAETLILAGADSLSLSRQASGLSRQSAGLSGKAGAESAAGGTIL
jgi:hypothetical protein